MVRINDELKWRSVRLRSAGYYVLSTVALVTAIRDGWPHPPKGKRIARTALFVPDKACPDDSTVI